MIRIRPARNEDRPAVWNIIKAVIAGGDTYVFDPKAPEDEMLAYWFAPDKHVYVAVMPQEPPAESDNFSVDAGGGLRDAVSDARPDADGHNEKVVGTFWLKPNQPGLGDHVCNAAYMVSPEAHGKGIGRKMGEFSFDEARRLGFTAMQFNFVVASNTAAVRLWQSLGLRIIGTVPNAFRHRQNGPTDAYIMYREL
ncbi:MAG: GNAT family N-acetyltransferase [Acidobacteria bacterium]|nr:GNAT family N-acetyltransferase [Acidobacteriota bacterium]